MNVIILAAGYATRLYPLTLNTPKPLLPVAGKPMIEHVLDKLAPIAGLERVLVVTNGRFAGQFQRWADSCPSNLKLSIVNDGTVSKVTKLGAIGDLHLVLTRERVDNDVIVVAGDNLFSDSLEGFGAFCHHKQAPVVAVYDVKDLQLVRNYNSITTGPEGRITHFEEKPANPTTTTCAIALYFYSASTLPLIHQYIAEGNNPDQPGRLVQWLYPRVPVYTWPVPGTWYDIGSRETLEEANRVFSQSSGPGTRSG
ncbi:MAG TPA: nucleotidyltransferase family protein [Clostridia bacterium]|nr:nucleotidyltransferase family protein [Clostridia bacterium]